MPGIRNIIKKIEKEYLVASKKEKVVTNVSATRNEKFVTLKRAYNMYVLMKCGLLTKLKEIYEEPEAIILFGSYSKGEDISKSDIDIAIITHLHKQPDLSPFENKLKRKIVIYEMDIKKAEPEFLNTLANGVVLSGYLRVR